MKYNLSEISDLIQSRRSIAPENFTERKIQREQIEKLIQCAVFAPNHKNTQPWHFHVFLDESMNLLRETLPTLLPESETSKISRMNIRLNQTSSAIIVTYTPSENVDEEEELIASACAIQNMLLMAHASGFSGFWSTPKFIKTKGFLELLELPLNQKCLGIIYFGYTKMNWPTSHRKPIEYVTTWH
ncbi:MAG: nitroreductase [Bacteroidota bacterium]|jgi:nitroreductase